MKVRSLIVFILCSMWVMPMGAMSLDSCRAMANRHYPLIAQYDLIRQSEEFSVQNAARSWIPKLYLSAQATYQSDAANMSEVWSSMGLDAMLQQMGKEIPDLYMRKFQGKVQLDIQQNIWDGGKSTADKRIAEAEAKKNAAQVDVDMYHLENRIDNLYFGILLLDEQLEQTERLIVLLNENLERVQALYNNNVVLQSDVDAVEVETLSAGQKLEQIRSSRLAYRQMLSLLVGVDITEEQLEHPAEIETSLEATCERPEVSLLNAKSDLLAAQMKTIRSYSMPQFTAFASGWYGYPTLNMFKSMQSAEWGLDALVGVKMSWNIGAYYTQGNRIKLLQNSQQQIAVQKDVFLFNRRLERTQENGEIVRLRKALQDDDRIVRLRQSVREAAESQYRHGTITTNDLLQRITDENNARSARAIHQIQLIQKEYEMQE